MDIRKLTADYSVSPQIAPSDLPAIAAAGFRTVICNRPDAEVGPDTNAAAVKAAAEAAGLTFVVNPVTHQGLNMDMVALQRDTIANAGGPVLAYCASGTRSTIVWALGQAGRMSTDVILTSALNAGYDLDGLRSRIDALAEANATSS